MTNIIMQKPDGGVTITNLTPEALAHMANAQAGLEAIAAKSPDLDLDEVQKYVDWVRDNIGLTLEAHGQLVKNRLAADHARGETRGVRPAMLDHSIVGTAKAHPKDRHFREAWHWDDGQVAVHMGRAREIHKDNLREARKEKLAALDAEYMKADESGDSAKKQQIAAKKQALRDVTKHPAILAASTPEELKALSLDQLEK